MAILIIITFVGCVICFTLLLLDISKEQKEKKEADEKNLAKLVSAYSSYEEKLIALEYVLSNDLWERLSFDFLEKEIENIHDKIKKDELEDLFLTNKLKQDLNFSVNEYKRIMK